MTLDWCPGIREACGHWSDAPMLQHTFEALQASIENESDASIDAAKGLVECVCRVIVEQLDNATAPLKPRDEATITQWVTAATRLLRLSDIRDRQFADLIKHHNGLTESLRLLRNNAGPLSHGKDGFIEALTVYHRRSAILAADTVVAFLHKAYMDLQLDPIKSREPWERFAEENTLFDEHVRLSIDTEDGDSPTLRFLLPSGDELPINIEVSRLLYQLDRDAYVEALNSARGVAQVLTVVPVEEKGEP